MLKYIRARIEKKKEEAEKTRLIREAKIRGKVLQARQQISDDMNFLVDIGSYKERKKYLMSDKEISQKKEDTINRIFGKMGILVVLSELQKEKDAADRAVQKGRRPDMMAEAEALIKELFQ